MRPYLRLISSGRYASIIFVWFYESHNQVPPLPLPLFLMRMIITEEAYPRDCAVLKKEMVEQAQ
jgi:hypothetical protein